mgnify:FL=1|jgi:hypothetical protein
MESLQYYVKLNDVVFKASADLFYSVVRSFFILYHWSIGGIILYLKKRKMRQL